MCKSNGPDKTLPGSVQKLAIAIGFVWFPICCLGIATVFIATQSEIDPAILNNVTQTCNLLSLGIQEYSVGAIVLGILGIYGFISMHNDQVRGSQEGKKCANCFFNCLASSAFLETSCILQIISISSGLLILVSIVTLIVGLIHEYVTCLYSPLTQVALTVVIMVTILLVPM
jgi:hypothetical protein